ncbi:MULTISPECIES: NfeD family protein [unclassified Streptomyces]|uniref:NfeD family protein n=1 Tax=unclassified Streptomyces TaxID=2593676 RepID=UPI000A9B8C78
MDSWSWWLLTTFAAGSATLVVVCSIAYHQLTNGPQIKMGIEALTGVSAVVQERVDQEGGRIKINGEIWSARAFHPSSAYEPGQQVDVVAIQGATALVI